MAKINIENRSIFCKDNLDILEFINSESIDLIYLDPPFNKNKVFVAPLKSSAQGASFSDIFRSKDIKDDWVQTIKEDNFDLYNFLNGIKSIEGIKSYNYCYLVYMAIRLIECRRILKNSGSLYLHCDPTMSHYLKILLDCILGEQNFRNEIIWYYTNKIPDKRKKLFTKSTDTILFYRKDKDLQYFKVQEEKRQTPQKVSKIKKVDGKKIYVRGADNKVITFMRENRTVDNVWKFPLLHSQKEYCGYPTQKPLALMERIIKASSKENDFILDPFCGCATTCVAAEKLGRKWIGIDVSIMAYKLVEKRLQKEIPCEIWDEKKIHFSTNSPQRTDDGKNHVLKKWVYVISNVSDRGYYKVGIAKNWQARLNSYQTADSDRAYKIEFKLQTPHYRKIEKHIHQKFKSKYEWVEAKLEDIILEIKNYEKELE